MIISKKNSKPSLERQLRMFMINTEMSETSDFDVRRLPISYRITIFFSCKELKDLDTYLIDNDKTILCMELLF